MNSNTKPHNVGLQLPRHSDSETEEGNLNRDNLENNLDEVFRELSIKMSPKGKPSEAET